MSSRIFTINAIRSAKSDPGRGCYAEEVITALHPNSYEIYETARDWLPHLSRLPNAVIRDCDGHTLSQTGAASGGLVPAQKVFVYLEFYATAGYLEEMARVVCPGGTVAFDIATEACLDDETVRAWTRRGSIYRPVSRVGCRVHAAAMSDAAWLPLLSAAARNHRVARLPPQLKLRSI